MNTYVYPEVPTGILTQPFMAYPLMPMATGGDGLQWQDAVAAQRATTDRPHMKAVFRGSVSPILPFLSGLRNPVWVTPCASPKSDLKAPAALDSSEP